MDWISQDVSGEESVIMADFSKDKAMLEEFTTGSRDMHSLVTRMVFPELSHLSTQEIKKNHKEKRDEAKGYEFLWNYLGNWSTIMRNFGLKEERAKELDNRYRSGFPGLIAWQNVQKKLVMERGYIIINPRTGHRAHIYDFENLSHLRDSFDEEFWARYREIPRGQDGKKKPRNAEESLMVNQVKHFAKRKNDSEKQSVNYCKLYAAGNRNIA